MERCTGAVRVGVRVVKGRYSWSSESRTWSVKYRPYYKQWLALLTTVEPLVYQPLPKLVVPKRILAQYEAGVPNKPISYTFRHNRNQSRLSELPDVVIPPQEKFEVGVL